MKSICNLIITTLAILSIFACTSQKDSQKNESEKVEVAVIYYPHWHTYPYGEKWFGKNWTEWEFVKNGKARFENHKYTLKPSTGYIDGANPQDVEKEIALASNCGIDVFIYDWYWYDKKMTMQESLEQGFFKAKNSDKMKFAIMWANHDRKDQFRPKLGEPRKMLMEMARTPEDFYSAMDYCIENYFQRPNYWKINGKPFFSILVSKFVEWNGGAKKVKEMLAKVDAKMKSKGLPEIHWNAMTLDPNRAEWLKNAGFDSITSYNIKSLPPEQKTKYKDEKYIYDYSDIATAHRQKWAEMRKRGIAYMPVVTRGWDCSLRCRLDEPFPWKKQEYPYGAIAVNNSPDIFQKLLADAKEFAKESPTKAVLINAWNEYTEGAYLLPDMQDDDASLRAIASVFGRKPANKYVNVEMYSHELITTPSATFENAPYGNHYKNKLDVWLPKNAKSKTPVVIYMHGGGWINGNMVDARISGSLEKLLANDIAVICIQYRLISDANAQNVYPPVKAPLDDVVKAIEFVKNNAQKWNLDVSKIALSGGSAGACSALYASLWNNCELGIKLVAPSRPQTSLDPKQMKDWIPNINYGAGAFGVKGFKNFLAKRNELIPIIEKYSPVSLLEKCDSKKAPKFILQYDQKEKRGDIPKDPIHSMLFGELFQQVCKKKNIDCQIEITTGSKMFDMIITELKK